jgi:ABC-type polysaccharide/polyol phosphate export permease
MQFMQRDFHVLRRQLRSYAINYGLIYPITYAFAFAYLQSQAYFGPRSTTMGTMLFCGNIIVILMVITYRQTINLLFDLESHKYVEYQITVLNPRLVIVQRILTSTLFTWLFLLPFFPVAYLAVGSKYLQFSAISWLALAGVLFISALCCSAYHQCAAILLPSSDYIGTMWTRVNYILISLGGFWIPLKTMFGYSRVLGTISLLNPLVYVTEGIRQSILGSTEFLSLSVCCTTLLVMTALFIGICWHQFKVRVDHL